jgi:hypothetical protein
MNQQQMQSMQNLMAAQQAQQQAQQNQQQAQAAQQQAQQQAQQNQQQQAAAQQQQQQQQSQPQGQAPPVQASPAQPPTSQPGPNSQQAQQHAQHQQAQQQQAQQQQAQQQQQQHQQAQNQMQVQNQAQAQAHAQAQQAAAVAMMQQQQRPIKGHCILKLVQFGDHLSDFRVCNAQQPQVNEWYTKITLLGYEIVQRPLLLDQLRRDLLHTSRGPPPLCSPSRRKHEQTIRDHLPRLTTILLYPLRERHREHAVDDPEGEGEGAGSQLPLYREQRVEFYILVREWIAGMTSNSPISIPIPIAILWRERAVLTQSWG